MNLRGSSMHKNTNTPNVEFRVGLTVVLCLAGFFSPYFFILALLVGCSLFEGDHNLSSENDTCLTCRYTATSADINWERFFLEACESPAESAFLEAMIQYYGLIPSRGILCGNGLTLDLQVKMPPYRADFVVDRWLVVEIDGAAYHSSPEAIARDKKRDEVMNSRGYSVLRIPAKIVLYSPSKAMQIVRSAIAKGNEYNIVHQIKKEEEQSKCTNDMSLHSAASSFMNFISDLNEYVSVQSIVQKENKDLLLAFHAEKLAIETSIEHALREIEIEKLISKDEQTREMYFESYARMSKIIDDSVGLNKEVTIVIPQVSEANKYSNANINIAVQANRQIIIEERSVFFISVRNRLNSDSHLKELVKIKLYKLGCGECWKYVS